MGTTSSAIHKAAKSVKEPLEQIAGSLASIEQEISGNDIGAQVKSAAAQITQPLDKVGDSLDDLNSFAILTRGISQSPQIGPAQPPGGVSLSQTAMLAVQQVLGWKPRDNDPRGFVSALTASFSREEFEGHVVCKWTPRTYAVQTDLEGGVTGAQASLFTRAKLAVDECQTLLDGLTNLRLDADPQDMESLKSLIAEQMSQVVSEFGMIAGPRIPFQDQVFATLLGPYPAVTDPDLVTGLIGTLRNEFGLAAFVIGQDYVNTVEEEQNLTNYRILCDYLTSLRSGWEKDKNFFKRGPNAKKVFFGTRLVLLTRNLTVVGDSVEQLRFALDSVFVGAAERETLEIDLGNDDRLFVEELFRWITDFAVTEGPSMIQNGGKYGVQNAFLPVVGKLRDLAKIAADPNFVIDAPPGYYTPRVRRSWLELIGQLQTLYDLSSPIDHIIPSQQ